MKKLKVLFFMDGIGNAGGIQEMAINWVKNMDRNSVQVDILSYDTGKKDNYKERFKQYGGEVYITPTFTKKGNIFNSLKLTKKFFQEHNDYDIIHAHASSKAYFVLKQAKKNNIKIRILHSHCASFINKRIVSLMMGYLLKPLANFVATDYFACSHEAGNFLFGKRRMNKEGIIIPNGIDVDKFIYNEETEKSLRKKYKLEDKLIIGNVGRFRPQKNHELLIDIFYKYSKINQNAMLVLLGDGELQNKIQEKVNNLKLDKRVLFLGYRKNVNEIIQMFDILVMTSLYEGLPVTAIETQCIGIPCILSDNITHDAKIIPEVEYVEINNIDEWVNAIDKFSTYSKNKKSIYYIKKNKFDIRDSSKMLQETYEKLYNKIAKK